MTDSAAISDRVCEIPRRLPRSVSHAAGDGVVFVALSELSDGIRPILRAVREIGRMGVGLEDPKPLLGSSAGTTAQQAGAMKVSSVPGPSGQGA